MKIFFKQFLDPNPKLNILIFFKFNLSRYLLYKKLFGSNKYIRFLNPSFLKPLVDIPLFAPTSKKILVL